ncbi:glutathione S-transfersae-related protein [Candidatus Rhodobacter oscarellae]|uniref:Glutathione S-transfersae-related protein n=1 Tax=Candidatus Rhodobacter oscarellae TaxID=1675527 RepID=A0A0J9E065_9RHOB|nr:MAPEG family protein [Candidatus Rhodobacter lobularis]KMW56331.1 glutathione S-transfersae-related protein [Candidatus Rhodobacter lobularis]
MPLITAWAALICGTFFMFQTLQVIRARGSAGVSLGDGGDKLLMRRMRGQANAAEQMPLTLIAMGLAEMLGAPGWALLPLAAVFTVSRLAHGYAFGWLEHNRPLRFYGMAGSAFSTFCILILLGVMVLTRSLGG